VNLAGPYSALVAPNSTTATTRNSKLVTSAMTSTATAERRVLPVRVRRTPITSPINPAGNWPMAYVAHRSVYSVPSVVRSNPSSVRK
jgi:hypothetical protein